jgi:hypothetical protein
LEGKPERDEGLGAGETAWGLMGFPLLPMEFTVGVIAVVQTPGGVAGAASPCLCAFAFVFVFVCVCAFVWCLRVGTTPNRLSEPQGSRGKQTTLTVRRRTRVWRIVKLGMTQKKTCPLLPKI